MFALPGRSGKGLRRKTKNGLDEPKQRPADRLWNAFAEKYQDINDSVGPAGGEKGGQVQQRMHDLLTYFKHILLLSILLRGLDFPLQIDYNTHGVRFTTASMLYVDAKPADFPMCRFRVQILKIDQRRSFYEGEQEDPIHTQSLSGWHGGADEEQAL